MSEVDAGVSGSVDCGLLTFTGTLLPGVQLSDAEAAIHQVVDQLIANRPTDYEMQKVKNRIEAGHTITTMLPQIKARELAFYEMLCNAKYFDIEVDLYDTISGSEISQTLQNVMTETNESVIYYKTKH